MMKLLDCHTIRVHSDYEYLRLSDDAQFRLS